MIIKAASRSKVTPCKSELNRIPLALALSRGLSENREVKNGLSWMGGLKRCLLRFPVSSWSRTLNG